MNLRLGEPEAALQPLKKLHMLLPDQPEVSTAAGLPTGRTSEVHAESQCQKVKTYVWESCMCGPACWRPDLLHARPQDTHTSHVVHWRLQVVHCLALAADMSGDSTAAIRWLEVLTSLVPHDPGVLCKLGAIYHRCVEGYGAHTPGILADNCLFLLAKPHGSPGRS